MRPLLRLCVLLAGLLAALRAAAQGPGAALAVTVREDGTGKPVADARVAVGRSRAQTDSAGRARLTSIAPGAHSFEVTRLGYRPERLILEIGSGDDAEVDVDLVPDAVSVTGVEVSGERTSRALRMVGFYDRQKMGSGSFLSRADLEKLPGGAPLGNVLRTVPGVRVVRQCVARCRYTVNVVQSTRSFNCTMQVFLDGMPLQGGQAEDIDRWAPNGLEGVEVYHSAAQVPVRFKSSRQTCGVVLLWTRAGP